MASQGTHSSPFRQRAATFSLDLKTDKRFLSQDWHIQKSRQTFGLETPPDSQVSTPILVENSPQLGARPDTPPSAASLQESAVVTAESTPVVAVLGVGYVGTHLVEVFSSKHSVIGFDVSVKRIQTLQLEQMQATGDLPDIEYTFDKAALRRATHFLISVPTLLLQDRTVDASYLRKALETVGEHARPGSTIVIESSVAVGMTRDLLGPMAIEKGFFAGMSPERVDPGRVEPPVASIPKIVSALEDIRPGSLASIQGLYSTVFDNVVPVTSPEVAEMTKLYENCQRMMCIAYANEMADACAQHNIDPYEVCGAAATKPFGYMSYLPGLGVGGHCIPVNPFYLLSNSTFPLLEAATKRMAERPGRIARDVTKKLLARSAALGNHKPRVLVVGMGFKKGQSTLSNSPGLAFLNAVREVEEVEVMWADSMVTQDMIPGVAKFDDELWRTESLCTFDAVYVAFLQPDMSEEVLKALPRKTDLQWLSKPPAWS